MTSPFQIITGDCMLVLPRIAPASIDVVVADPTYAETSLAWDKRVHGWLELVRPLLKPSGSVWFFTSVRHLVAVSPELKGWVIAQDLVWEKHNGTNAAKDRFRRVHELVVQLYPKDAKWGEVYHAPQHTKDAKARQIQRKTKPTHWERMPSGHYLSTDGGPRLQRSVLHVRSCHGYAIHPTQKPVGIVAPLVRYSCPPGGVVLDCFAGSGTTGVVCVQEQRQFIGIEKDAAMADKARARIAQEIANGRQQSIEGMSA